MTPKHTQPFRSSSQLRRIGALWRLFLVLFCFACKPEQPTSKTKSLENIASQEKVVTNTCQGPYRSEAETWRKKIDTRILKSENMKRRAEKLVLQALSSVPPGLQAFYFHTLGGTIQIVPKVVGNAQAFCNGREACVDPENGRSILLINEAGAIAHNTVQLFAYALVQLSQKLEAASNTLEADQLAFGAFISMWQRSLTEAFLADAQQPQWSRLRKFADQVKGSSGVKRRQHELNIFSHTFDSFYCSETETRRRFSVSLWPKLRPAFDKVRDHPVGIRWTDKNGRQLTRVFSWQNFANERKTDVGFKLDAGVTGGFAPANVANPSFSASPVQYGGQNFYGFGASTAGSGVSPMPGASSHVVFPSGPPGQFGASSFQPPSQSQSYGAFYSQLGTVNQSFDAFAGPGFEGASGFPSMIAVGLPH